MKRTHLIIFTLAAMALLLGFNIFNSNAHEKNRIEMMNESATVDRSTDQVDSSNSSNIASKPLGEQPKAIMDSATTQIEQAQQADADRLAQLKDAQ